MLRRYVGVIIFESRSRSDEVRRDVAAFIRDLRRQRVLLSPDDDDASGGMARRWIDAALSLARRRPWPLLLVARLAVALFGWTATIRAWERRYPQPLAAHEDAGTIDAIDRAVRSIAARSLLHHECKERGLACLAMARAEGIAADLVIGLTYSPIAAHVWVECGNRIISDLPEHCRPYREVMRYGRGAAR
jgi:hypothetical protein